MELKSSLSCGKLFGNYSVKTGYFKAWEDTNALPSPSSQARQEQSFLWKTIWNSRVPPKIRNFIWRLCNNAVSTGVNLHRRFRDRSQSAQYVEWLLKILSISFLNASGSTNASPPAHHAPAPCPSRWRVPPPECLKLNIDGATDLHHQRASSAVIVRNHEGLLLSGASRSFYCTSAIQAEAEALRDAFNLANSLGITSFQIESDNVELPSSRASVHWIPRSANKVADAVAKLALRHSLPCNWTWMPSVSIRALLLEDKMSGSAS
ncbi:intron-binding protein aquarius-like [Senna tora]|uniref:Intron-binding protein aquarius-like n=1 Tax=Senna tora TaxID=362788 RepID=A0A835C823_9FABA|nr:intron-binding protein aquarius-like [Senna tora]